MLVPRACPSPAVRSFLTICSWGAFSFHGESQTRLAPGTLIAGGSSSEEHANKDEAGKQQGVIEAVHGRIKAAWRADIDLFIHGSLPSV
jgi:hypothetical protein